MIGDIKFFRSSRFILLLALIFMIFVPLTESHKVELLTGKIEKYAFFLLLLAWISAFFETVNRK